FLNSGLATERATTAFVERPANEISHVGFAALRLDQTGVACALQFGIRPMPRAHDVSVGMQFVRAGEVARACHRDGMIPVGAAFSREQVVPTVALVEMRRFSEAEGSALENVDAIADELALLH